jgi:alpha-glucuronidase
VDAARFRRVQAFLRIQEAEARWWRDASVAYWESFSHLPLPADYEAPAHQLGWYERLRCPADPRKPRCAAVTAAAGPRREPFWGVSRSGVKVIR